MAGISTSTARSLRVSSDLMQRGLVAERKVRRGGRGRGRGRGDGHGRGRTPWLWSTRVCPEVYEEDSCQAQCISVRRLLRY